MSALLITAIMSLVLPTNAHAENMINSSEAGKIAAENTMNAFKNDIQNKASFEQALDSLLDKASSALLQEGYILEAANVKNEWVQMSAIYFHNPMSILKLGDHAPLNQWLADTYNMLEGTLGREKCATYHLDDIKSINYGFNVTFHPAGDPATGTAWGKTEYSEHFVPFTTAVSYWIGFLACKEFGKSGTAAQFCNGSLDTFRSTIESYIAPALSDEIYNHFNP